MTKYGDSMLRRALQELGASMGSRIVDGILVNCSGVA